MEPFKWRGRVWIEKDGRTFLGYGRAILLERIREYGSITQAAKSMGMGYRHAWHLVDSMNKSAPKPLVVTQRGGKRGGGARLTGEGELALRHFWDFYRRFQGFLEDESTHLT